MFNEFDACRRGTDVLVNSSIRDALGKLAQPINVRPGSIRRAQVDLIHEEGRPAGSSAERIARSWIWHDRQDHHVPLIQRPLHLSGQGERAGDQGSGAFLDRPFCCSVVQLFS
jgi:hypothetical protein